MKCGQNHLDTRPAGLLVDLNRNTAAVIDHRDTVVDVDRDINTITSPSQGFIHAVIDNLENEMVETVGPGAADVHGWAFPHRLEALEDFNLVDAVRAVTVLRPVHLRHTSSQNFPRPRGAGSRFRARPGVLRAPPSGLCSGRVTARTVWRDCSDQERAIRSGEVLSVSGRLIGILCGVVPSRTCSPVLFNRCDLSDGATTKPSIGLFPGWWPIILVKSALA